MSADRLGRALVALAFCAFVVWAVLFHALPWSLDRLPWAAPITLVLTVALLSIVWATVDVLRGRSVSGG